MLSSAGKGYQHTNAMSVEVTVCSLDNLATGFLQLQAVLHDSIKSGMLNNMCGAMRYTVACNLSIFLLSATFT